MHSWHLLRIPLQIWGDQKRVELLCGVHLTMLTGIVWRSTSFNTLRPRQNGRHFADDTFKRIFMNENVRISINISLKLVPKGLINNIPALVQIMAWRRSGDKPLSELMLVILPTHICVARPQWVSSLLKDPVFGVLLKVESTCIIINKWMLVLSIIQVAVVYNNISPNLYRRLLFCCALLGLVSRQFYV